MKTIKDVLQLSTKYFEEKKIDRPRRQAEELLCYVLDLKRIQLYMDIDRPLNTVELEKCRVFLKRRATGEPFAYIAGFVDFFGCKIHVNQSVLIPRQETEILLDIIHKSFSKDQPKQLQVWDICCGSGCMGIALKKKNPDLSITLSDLSIEALAVAKKNAIENSAEVNILQGDLLEPFKGMKSDLVLCNPPYVTEEEYDALDAEVRNYEPKTALVGGPTGLEFYRRLNEELPAYLNPKAKIWLEIGWMQGSEMLKLFHNPFWTNVQVMKDWSGHDRFFTAQVQ